MYFVPYTITALCVGKHPYLSTWGGRCCFIIFLPMFYRLSPLWGEIGLFDGEQ
jgi:hypothetical protein